MGVSYDFDIFELRALIEMARAGVARHLGYPRPQDINTTSGDKLVLFV